MIENYKMLIPLFLISIFYSVNGFIDQSLYIGCFQDIPYDRDLKNLTLNPTMTVDFCFYRCNLLGYNFAGLQYSSECYCGFTYGKYGQVSEANCNFRCQGNASQVCGGLNSNSIWRLSKNIAINTNSSSSNTTSLLDDTNLPNNLWFNIVNFTLAEWSIYYPIQSLNTNSQIRLFDLNDLNIYAGADYFPNASSIQVNILINSNFDKKIIALDPNQFPVSSMILSWKNPMLIVLINCKLAGQITFTSVNEINIMSLPYIKPNVITQNGVGIFFNTIRQALLRASCVDTNFNFPSPTSPDVSDQTTDSSNLDPSVAEWSFLYNFLVFQSSVQTVRLFDFVDQGVYINSNFIKGSFLIEINIFYNNIFDRKVISIDQSFLPITNMLVSWKSPNLIIHINCKYVNTLTFITGNETNLMSLPYTKPGVIAAGGNGEFFNNIRDALIQSSCVGPDFVFPSFPSSSTLFPNTNPSSTTNPYTYTPFPFPSYSPYTDSPLSSTSSSYTSSGTTSFTIPMPSYSPYTDSPYSTPYVSTSTTFSIPFPSYSPYTDAPQTLSTSLPIPFPSYSPYTDSPLTFSTTSTSFSSYTPSTSPFITGNIVTTTASMISSTQPNTIIKHAEWSTILSSRLFLNTATVIRLINYDYNNTFVSVDFFPISSTIEVNLLINLVYNKRIINVDKALLPIALNMIVSWRSPLLTILIDCKYVGQLLYLASDQIEALSRPYNNPNIILSNVNYFFSHSIRDSLVKGGCVDTNFQFPTPNQDNSSIYTTTTMSSTTTTTLTTTNSSIPILNNDFTLDSDFILLIYNTRVSQFKNLLDLTSFLNSFELLNQRLLNLTFASRGGL